MCLLCLTYSSKLSNSYLYDPIISIWSCHFWLLYNFPVIMLGYLCQTLQVGSKILTFLLYYSCVFSFMKSMFSLKKSSVRYCVSCRFFFYLLQLQALTKCVKQLSLPKASSPMIPTALEKERIVASSTPLPQVESKEQHWSLSLLA